MRTGTMFARAIAAPWSRVARPAVGPSFVCRRAAAAAVAAVPCRHSSGDALLFKLTGKDQLGVVSVSVVRFCWLCLGSEAGSCVCGIASNRSLLTQLTPDATARCAHQVSDYSSILAKHNAKLLDIEQASCVTHQTFTLNMLVSVGDQSDAMVTDMLLNSQDRHIKMDVVVVKGDNLRGDDEPQVRHALTLMKEDLGFDVIAKVADAAAQHGFNIQQVRRSAVQAPALPQLARVLSLHRCVARACTSSPSSWSGIV